MNVVRCNEIVSFQSDAIYSTKMMSNHFDLDWVISIYSQIIIISAYGSVCRFGRYIEKHLAGNLFPFNSTVLWSYVMFLRWCGISGQFFYRLFSTTTFSTKDLWFNWLSIIPFAKPITFSLRGESSLNLMLKHLIEHIIVLVDHYALTVWNFHSTLPAFMKSNESSKW